MEIVKFLEIGKFFEIVKFLEIVSFFIKFLVVVTLRKFLEDFGRGSVRCLQLQFETKVGSAFS